MPRGGNEGDGFVIRDEASEKALTQIPGDERIGLDSKRRELSKALLVIIVGGIVEPGQEGAAPESDKGGEVYNSLISCIKI